MVSFVCGACQDTIKGRAVAGHRCGAPLSCVDCGTDFGPSAARAHQTCISEAEKHQKTLYKPKPGKTGKVARDPQDVWNDQIAAAAARPGPHQEWLLKLVPLTKSPRKLKQFTDFCYTTIKCRDKKGEPRRHR